MWGGGGGGGKGLGENHWLAPLLLGGDLLGRSQPAERYGCLGGRAFNLVDMKPSDTQ